MTTAHVIILWYSAVWPVNDARNVTCHIWPITFIKPYCKYIRIMSKYWKQSVLHHTRKRMLINLTTSWPVFTSKLIWVMFDTLSVSRDWTTSSCEAMTSIWRMGPNVRIRFSTNNLSGPRPSRLQDLHATPLWPPYIRQCNHIMTGYSRQISTCTLDSQPL